jgi:tyrosyl-DNA phosphodiesterase-1
MDWTTKSQGFFIQDFPLKSDLKTSVPSSLSFFNTFESDLCRYLKEIKLYSTSVQAALTKNVINNLCLYDFLTAEVVLIPSVPGRHIKLSQGNNLWGHLKLKSILDSYQNAKNLQTTQQKTRESTVTAFQCSSIGSMGKNENFINELAFSMGSRVEDIRVIWPTVDMVRGSLEGYQAGLCLPCDSKVLFIMMQICHSFQPYNLKHFLIM